MVLVGHAIYSLFNSTQFDGRDKKKSPTKLSEAQPSQSRIGESMYRKLDSNMMMSMMMIMVGVRKKTPLMPASPGEKPVCCPRPFPGFSDPPTVRQRRQRLTAARFDFPSRPLSVAS